jgi:hypothetical protein
MKKIVLFLSLFLVVSMACDATVTVAPSMGSTPLPPNTMIPASATPISATAVNPTQVSASPTSIPATLIPSATSTSSIPPTNGGQVFYRPLSLVLSPGLASGISGLQFPRVDGQDHPYWELTPGHTVIKLEGYTLQGKFHQPQIYVYPAMAYVELFPGAFESMHRLRNVMNPAAPITADQLPAVPFFNAAQVFASNVQAIPFQNGSGIRFLTEYAQYPAPVNNHEMFYHFQGFTNDGEYYIVAILPVTVPVLAETGDAGSPLPSDGILYPFLADPNPATLQMYYEDVANLLSATPNEAFTPTIGQLDLLIQSMRITP